MLELKGATKSSPTMTPPIDRVNIHSKYVTRIISAAFMADPICSVLLGGRYVYYGVPTTLIVIPVMQTTLQTKVDPEPVTSLPGEIKVSQNPDKTLRVCFKKLPKASSNPPKLGEFSRKSNLFYQRTGKGKLEHHQLVVHAEYHNQVQHFGHTFSLSDHMGTGATTQQITCHNYRSGMNGDITMYIKSYPECQRVAPKHWTAPVMLDEMPIMSNPFKRVVVNIVFFIFFFFAITLINVCNVR